MPTCKKCGHYGGSADFRRIPGNPPTWQCKDGCQEKKESK